MTAESVLLVLKLMAHVKNLKERVESVTRQAIQEAVVRILSRQGSERLCEA